MGAGAADRERGLEMTAQGLHHGTGSPSTGTDTYITAHGQGLHWVGVGRRAVPAKRRTGDESEHIQGS